MPTPGRPELLGRHQASRAEHSGLAGFVAGRGRREVVL